MRKLFGEMGELDSFKSVFTEKFVADEGIEKYNDFLKSASASNVINEEHRIENFEYLHNYGTHYGWVRASIILVSMKNNRVESYMLTFTDIDKEKKREEEQREDHKLLSFAISDSYDGIYEINMDDCSAYEVKIVDGYAIRQKRRQKYDAATAFVAKNFVHPEEAEKYKKHLSLKYIKENIRDEKSTLYFEFRLRTANHSRKYRWISYTLRLVPEKKKRSVMLFTNDITKRKQSELETQKALKDAFEIATSANNAKSDFLSKISHDIRTPMNTIVGMTTIAGAHIDEKERVEDCLRKIDIASQHLLDLINEVLDMSKIESGKMSINEDTVNISDLIDKLVTMLRPRAEKKNQEFKVRISNIEHENVIGDELRLQQVFNNLLSNAVKYTHENGKIELTIREIDTNYIGMANYEFVFRDNGIGMTQEFIEKIFDPFTREEDSRTSKIKGTGLGMAITKQIVNMMHGTIEVRSKLNEGSEFTVNIFFKLPENNDAKLDKLRGRSVLVIDDKSAEETCRILRSMGMCPITALSCDEALELIEKMGDKSDELFAVIADWKLPDRDGIETTRELKRVLKPDIPVIIASGYDWSEVEHDGKEAGAAGFVSKPLFKSRLIPMFMTYTDSPNEEEKRVSIMEQADFSGRRILLAEDNEINMEIAVEILSYTNAEIDTAENGKEAFEKVRDHEPGYYQMVLMDVQMPVMNGYEAARKIREIGRPDTDTLPIIACTANAFVEDVNNARKAGMNGHISKPIDFEKLIRTMNRWLN
jgi:signal transduction histidine kinase/DNA-binding response OmpR family regulator